MGRNANPAHPHLPNRETARTVAVVLCAGQGTRMGAAGNKVFLPLASRPIIAHTLAAFEHAPTAEELLRVAHPAEVA
jgi:2-C-methyl-D-erythritol 4-phosphate cytidylyltransferase